MRGQASDLGSNWFLTRNLNFTRDYLAAVQEVTGGDLQRVAARYLTDDNLTIISLNPKGAAVRAGRCDQGDVSRKKSSGSNSQMVCGFWCAKIRGYR